MASITGVPPSYVAPGWVPAADRLMEEDVPDHLIHEPTPIPPLVAPSRKKQLAQQLRRLTNQQFQEPPLLTRPVAQEGQRWRQFMEYGPGMPPRKLLPEEQVEADAWLDQYYKGPNWKERKANHFVARKESMWKRFTHTILQSPGIPLIFRLIVLAISAASLALAIRIRKDIGAAAYACAQDGELIFAIAWPSIAIVYTLFIMQDEFGAPPIGLRHYALKLSLTLADLIFIILNSANISSAFQLLIDWGPVCNSQANAVSTASKPVSSVTTNGTSSNYIPRCRYDVGTAYPERPPCELQRVLCAMLVIAGVSWVLTFTVTIFRLVYKVQVH